MVDRVAIPGSTGTLLEHYARTRIEFRDPATAADSVLHPEPPGHFGEWPFPGSESAAVVTAWHPRSEPGRDPERNRADLEHLRRIVLGAGFRAIDCVGIGAATDVSPSPAPGLPGHPDVDGIVEPWSEPSLLVPGVSRGAACDWAARFDQNAIFWWTATQWRIVGVLLEMPDVVLGWRLSRPGEVARP
ncbi:MAG: DUF3293 domain-containing protein [Alphaproteobacteria bacterium]